MGWKNGSRGALPPGTVQGGWAAVIGRGNSKRRLSTGANNREGAEAFCRKLNTQLEFERRGRGPITIDRIMALYIDDRRQQGTVNNRMKTFRDIIKLWPTLGDFAEDMGLKYVTAQVMYHRDSVHPRHWTRLVSAARRAGHCDVTYERLAIIAEQRHAQPQECEAVA